MSTVAAAMATTFNDSQSVDTSDLQHQYHSQPASTDKQHTIDTQQIASRVNKPRQLHKSYAATFDVHIVNPAAPVHVPVTQPRAHSSAPKLQFYTTKQQIAPAKPAVVHYNDTNTTHDIPKLYLQCVAYIADNLQQFDVSELQQIPEKLMLLVLKYLLIMSRLTLDVVHILKQLDQCPEIQHWLRSNVDEFRGIQMDNKYMSCSPSRNCSVFK